MKAVEFRPLRIAGMALTLGAISLGAMSLAGCKKDDTAATGTAASGAPVAAVAPPAGKACAWATPTRA
jgi:hypothetical protein